MVFSRLQFKYVSLSVFSQENSPLLVGFLPKCPYADVISQMGLLSFNISLIPLGDKLKFSPMIFFIFSTFDSSPSESLTKIDNGFETQSHKLIELNIFLKRQRRQYFLQYILRHKQQIYRLCRVFT